MRLSKVTNTPSHTYVVLRDETGEDYCTITLPGRYLAEMPNSNALNLKQHKGGEEP